MIEIIGQQKYDFQDLVCLWLLLELDSQEEGKTIEVFPELMEDALIKYTLDDKHYSIEIQVKGSEKDISIKDLSEHLAHFPNRQANNTLLERLHKDSSKYVILIYSGRGDDSVKNFIKPLFKKFSSNREITLQDAQSLLEQFKTVQILGETKLKAARRNHLGQIDFDIKILQNNLDRLIVIEKITEEIVKENIKRVLNRHHSISDVVIEKVVLLCIEEIKKHKSERSDVYPDILQILCDHRQYINPKDYLETQRDKSFFNKLTSNYVLLLTGRAQVGKTYLARHIASLCAQIGFDVLVTRNIEEAEAFFFRSGSDKKLVLLDDPFGGAQRTPDFFRAMNKIKGLIDFTSSHRLLIITQRQEALLQGLNANAVETLHKYKDHQWCNLNRITFDDFLLQVWGSYKVGDQKLDRITRSVLTNSEVTVGALHHLKSNPPENVTKESVIGILNQSSEEFGMQFRDKCETNLFFNLAIILNDIDIISLNDIKKVIDINIDDLSELETTGQIIYVLDDKIRFTHSYYLHAGLNSNSLSESKWHEVEQLFCTIFESDYIQMILNSIKGLEVLYQKSILINKEGLSKKFFELADKYIEASPYPVVRDALFEFLFPKFHNYGKSIHDLERWINLVSFYTLEDFEWGNGVAKIDIQMIKTYDLFSLMKDGDKLQLLDQGKISKFHNDETYYLDPQSASSYLLSIHNNSEEIVTDRTISKFIIYKEAAIRGVAINHWLRINHINDHQVLTRVFNSYHPLITNNVIDGIMCGWGNFSTERQYILYKNMLRMLKSKVSSIIVFHYLINLHKEYIREYDMQHWVLYARLMYRVLPEIPPNIFFNSGRFFTSLEKAFAKGLSEKIKKKLVTAYCIFIDNALRENFMLDDYAFAPIEFILAIEDVPFRISTIERLLFIVQDYTAPLCRILRDLVDDWQQLSDKEKVLLNNIIFDKSRNDIYWIQATMRGYENIPNELEPILCLNNQSLLEHCALLWSCEPNELAQLGISMRNIHVKKYIINNIASNLNHPLCTLVWHRSLSLNYDLLHETLQILLQNESDINHVFELLLSITINQRDFYSKAWYLLLESNSDFNFDQNHMWTKRIKQTLPAIVEDKIQDLCEQWFIGVECDLLLNTFCANEIFLYKWIKMCFEILGDGFQDGIGSENPVLVVKIFLEDENYELNSTVLIEKAARESGVFDQISESLNKRRNYIKNQQESIKQEYQFIYDIRQHDFNYLVPIPSLSSEIA